MSLGIAINNEFLELNPGTEMELELSNPFLQFADELIGDFSMPFELKPTPGNLRKLGYAGLFQKRVDNTGIDAALFDGGLQLSIGKIKFEKNLANLNNVAQGSMSCYYLSAIGNFYQDVKDKRLRDINVGGTRSFPWTDFQRRTGNGFWQHIHAVVDNEGGPYDYAFYPVINQQWGEWFSDDDRQWVEVMNNMGSFNPTEPIFGTGAGGDNSRTNPIVPFPYLKYVLERVCEYIGWTVEGDILTDASFQKITLINFQAIDWGYKSYDFSSGGWDTIARNPVSFDLKWNLADISIAEFFIYLKNRLGWWYDFDRRNKIIKIQTLSAVSFSESKDFTTKSSPVIPKSTNKDSKIYALKNEFVGDMEDAQPEFTTILLQGDVATIASLPVASSSLANHAYLVRSENNYYVCRTSDTTPYPWEWQMYASNIYDYLPAGNNQEIRTGASTVGNEKYNAYLDFIPRMDLPGIWPGYSDVDQQWKLHLAFYYGKQNNKAGDAVCFASSGIHDSNGNEVGDWSLAFKCKNTAGEEVGLYDLQLKPMLDRLINAEEVEVTLWLDRVEYLNLKFSDEIVIAGVKLIIRTMKPVIPYKNRIVLDCIRV